MCTQCVHPNYVMSLQPRSLLIFALPPASNLRSSPPTRLPTLVAIRSDPSSSWSSSAFWSRPNLYGPSLRVGDRPNIVDRRHKYASLLKSPLLYVAHVARGTSRVEPRSGQYTHLERISLHLSRLTRGSFFICTFFYPRFVLDVPLSI